MTTAHKIARRKLSMLELAGELGNVSKACRLMGYSRQQFYEIRRNFPTYGAEGLLDRLPGTRNPHPNRVSEEIEQAVWIILLNIPLMDALESPRTWPFEDRTSLQAVSGACGAATTFYKNTSVC